MLKKITLTYVNIIRQYALNCLLQGRRRDVDKVLRPMFDFLTVRGTVGRTCCVNVDIEEFSVMQLKNRLHQM